VCQYLIDNGADVNARTDDSIKKAKMPSSMKKGNDWPRSEWLYPRLDYTPLHMGNSSASLICAFVVDSVNLCI
jgi:hypothetical protein